MNGLVARRSRGRMVVLLLGALLLFGRPSWASCSPPEISVDPREIRAGERILVSGVGWADGCREPQEGGCGRDEQPEPSPLAGIEVRLVPDTASRASVALGSVDASEDYEFELAVVVPPSTPPGRYTIEARSGSHVNEPRVPIVVTD